MTRAESSHSAEVLASVLTCPHCGHQKREQMPVEACQFFYECERCKTLLRPKPGLLRVLLVRLGEMSASAGAGAMLWA